MLLYLATPDTAFVEPTFMKLKLCFLFVGLLISCHGFAQKPTNPAGHISSKTKADSWYKQQLWLVGSDCIPATAFNQLEMWQADTFDAATIDKELGWAKTLA